MEGIVGEWIVWTWVQDIIVAAVWAGAILSILIILLLAAAIFKVYLLGDKG